MNAAADISHVKRLFAFIDHLPFAYLARIIHEYLLQRPILSPGVAFLVRAPRRTATHWLSRNGRLTISPARTIVARFIQRAVRLARSPRKGRVLARLWWAGAMEASVSAASRPIHE